MADAAPNAQHDPQDPWSRISLIDSQDAHFFRESNSSGKSSEFVKRFGCSSKSFGIGSMIKLNIFRESFSVNGSFGLRVAFHVEVLSLLIF